MQISMKKHIANCSQASALVTAILQGEAHLLGAALCKSNSTCALHSLQCSSDSHGVVGDNAMLQRQILLWSRRGRLLFQG